MTTIGLVGMALGFGSSFWGAQLQTRTIQVEGNPRIQTGVMLSFLGGLALSLGGVSLFLSLI
jgi:hypothetical protein